MKKYFSAAVIFSFLSLPAFGIHIVDLLGKGNKDFISFWTSNYLKWSAQNSFFLPNASSEQRAFIKKALVSYKSWGQINGAVLEPNFNFIYEAYRNENLSSGIYLRVSPELKNDLKRLLVDEGLDIPVQGVKGIELWPGQNSIKAHFSQNIQIYQNGKKLERYEVSGPYFNDFRFFKSFTGARRVSYQTKKVSRNKTCYLSNIKVIPLLSLPKKLLNIVSLHQKGQSLTIRNVEECDDGTFRILFP